MKKRAPQMPAGELNDTPELPRGGGKFLVPPTYDVDGVQATSGIDELGREHPDPTPVEVPLHMRSSPALDQMIKNYVRREISQLAAQQQFETFDEANDFSIEGEEWDDEETIYEFEGDRSVGSPAPTESGPPPLPSASAGAAPNAPASGGPPGGAEPPPASGGAGGQSPPASPRE